MSDENLEGNQDPNQNLDDDQTLKEDVKFEDNELDTMDQEHSKKVKTLSFQKKRYRELYEKEKSDRETEKAEWEKSKEPGKKEVKPSKEDVAAAESDRLELIELKQDNPDLTREQLAKAQKLAKAEGMTSSEMIESNYFQAYLKTEKEEAGPEGATPAPSNRDGQRNVSFEGIIKNPKLYRDLPKEKREEFVKWKQENYPEA